MRIRRNDKTVQRYMKRDERDQCADKEKIAIAKPYSLGVQAMALYSEHSRLEIMIARIRREIS